MYCYICHLYKQEMELWTSVCTSFHFCQLFTDHWRGRTSFLSSEIDIYFLFFIFFLFFLFLLFLFFFIWGGWYIFSTPSILYHCLVFNIISISGLQYYTYFWFDFMACYTYFWYKSVMTTSVFPKFDFWPVIPKSGLQNYT